MMKELVGEEHVEEDRLNIDEIIEELLSARYKNPGSLILLDRKKVMFVLDRA